MELVGGADGEGRRAALRGARAPGWGGEAVGGGAGSRRAWGRGRPGTHSPWRSIWVDTRLPVDTFDPATGRRTVLATEQHVGAASGVRGGLVVNLRDGVACYDADGALSWLHREVVPGRRGNDAGVAPDGSLGGICKPVILNSMPNSLEENTAKSPRAATSTSPMRHGRRARSARTSPRCRPACGRGHGRRAASPACGDVGGGTGAGVDVPEPRLAGEQVTSSSRSRRRRRRTGRPWAGRSCRGRRSRAAQSRGAAPRAGRRARVDRRQHPRHSCDWQPLPWPVWSSRDS